MYTVKYKRRFWTKTIRNVLAHSFNQEQNKMMFFLETGCFEVRDWTKCEMSLGPDWKAHADQLEKEYREKKLQQG